MAVQTVTVTFTAQASNTFTFPQPVGAYAKALGDTITDGFGGVVLSFAPDSGSGTITGTLNASDAFTGSVEVWIADKP